MKGFKRNPAFLAVCLVAGLAVFGVTYTLLGLSQDRGGSTQPQPAARTLFDVLAGGDVTELKQVLEDGADPNAINEDGVTVLQWTVLGVPTTATVYGQVQALLGAGANPNIPDGRGRTALHYAAEHGGSNAVTQALIDGGGVVNTQDQTGMTALQLAAMLGTTGAQSAIEQATTVRPPEYEKLNALGNFSQRLRAETTEEGKKAILEREAASMVERGWMTEEEREALLQAIENLGD